MLHTTITPRLSRKQGSRNYTMRGAFRTRPATTFDKPLSRITPVPRLDLLVILVLAVAGGALTAAATGQFEPLPLLAGVIIAGVVRSLRVARQRG